ncbi:unnamed protein product [Linum trigynum]|uniref:Zinc knuckle (CCHC-type) family protein n=1 Tax=Linum trigynum TaxID=586398 RepID=A0AAV2FFH4_9ROSI
MNADESSSIALNDLGLVLSYSNRSGQRRLNNGEGSGAGTNAGPNVEMTFAAATDPLSELVWSPRKGLSIKCADRSFFGRRQPSHLLVSRSRDIVMGSSIDKNLKEEEENSMERDANVKSEAGDMHQLPNGMEIMPLSGSFHDLKKAEHESDVAQHGQTSQEPGKRVENIADGSKLVAPPVVLASGEDTCKDCSPGMQAEASLEEIPEASAHFVENERKDEVEAEAHGHEREESSDENDIGSPLLGQSKHVAGLEHCSIQDDEDESSPREVKQAVKQSPTNSRNKSYRRKGKAKALSDGDVSGKQLDDGSESDESIESCTSARHFSKGKRRANFDLPLMLGSKRGKRPVQDTAGSSSSLLRQDSSFMNWISNMVNNGFLKTTQQGETAPSLTLTVGNSDNIGNGNSGGPNLLQCNNRSRDSSSRDAGFQSIFQSLYCPKHKAQDNVSVDLDHQVEAEKFTKPDSQMCDVSATPIACRPVTGGSGSFKEQNGRSSNSSHGRARINAADNICDKVDPFASAWIMRFIPKPSGSPIHKGMPAKSHLQNLLTSSTARAIIEGDEQSDEGLRHVKACSSSADASFSFYKVKSHHLGESSSIKQNPVLPSQRFTNSKAMASVFARRLDALKQIMPSDDKAHSAIICFFCGARDHHLRDCLEMTDGELEELFRNITSYEGREEPPCFCIRCFQLNHWAVACPNAPSSVTPRLNELGGAVKLQLNWRNNHKEKLVEPSSTSRYPVASENTACATNYLVDKVSHEATTSSKKPRLVELNCIDKGVSSPGGTRSKERQVNPFLKSSSGGIFGVPKGISDAVKSLRLSRTDILRWMNSGVPLKRLDGFFLRLRLGKWQAGFGGTGYHVARIAVAEGESSQPKSRTTSLPVDIGGIRCVVEAPYVSNQDFREDELTAWWSAARMGDGGTKVPCEEDLRVKLKEKQMLLGL